MSHVQVHFKYMLISVYLTVFVVYLKLNIILYLQIADGFLFWVIEEGSVLFNLHG